MTDVIFCNLVVYLVKDSCYIGISIGSSSRFKSQRLLRGFLNLQSVVNTTLNRPAGWATTQNSVLSKTVDPMPMLLLVCPGSIGDSLVSPNTVAISILSSGLELTFS